MDNQQPIRDQLVKLLQGGQSYTPMRQLLTGIPFELAGKRVDGLPYTPAFRLSLRYHRRHVFNALPQTL